MRGDELPLALIAFIGFVVVAPIWVRYLEAFEAPQAEHQVMAGMMLFAVAALFVSSWISPALARLVLGFFIIMSVVLMAPWLHRFTGMIGGQLGGAPGAEFVLRLFVSAVVIAYLVSLGKRGASS